MTELVLIRVTGADKPGLTSNISAMLAQYGVTVLDIGQAEIHDTLSLGILAAIPSKEDSGSVLKDVLFRAHELGLSVRFTLSPLKATSIGSGSRVNLGTLLPCWRAPSRPAPLRA